MAHILRLIRLFFWFLFGLYLGGYTVISYAETISATDSSSSNAVVAAPYYHNNVLASGSTPTSACQSFDSSYDGSIRVTTSPSDGSYKAFRCTYHGTPLGIIEGTGYCSGVVTTSNYCPSVKTCPSGQNWTLSGTICNRPDCTGDDVRNSQTGVCEPAPCVPGQTRVGGLCITVCPAGYHGRFPDNGQCEKDCFGDQVQASSGVCECLANKKSYFTGSINQTADFQSKGDCVGGCQQKAGFFSIPLGAAGAAATGNASLWYTSATSTGATCSGATQTGVVKATLPPPAPLTPPTPEKPADPKETPKNNADPDSCSASGGIYYTSGGSGKCSSPTPDNATDKQKLVAGEKVTTTTNPDGSTTETRIKETVVTDGQGGSKTSSTTTTTTKDAAGNVTGITTKQDAGSGSLGKGEGGAGDGIKGFCAENPESIICKSSSWSGDCDVAPVCDGDAVQCATAKAVWEHRCVNKWAEKSNALSEVVDQTNLFGDQAKIDAALNKDGTKDFDVLAKFQEKRQTYLSFSSSCSPDLSFDFKGQHYQFDTTVLCQFGLFIKILLHLTAYMILIRLLTVKLF